MYKLTEVQFLRGWRGKESSEGLFVSLEDIGTLKVSEKGTTITVDCYLEMGPKTKLTSEELRKGLESFWQNAKKLVEMST